MIFAIDYLAKSCYCIYKYSNATKEVTIVHYEKDKSYRYGEEVDSILENV